jgi:hypothetical protein
MDRRAAGNVVAGSTAIFSLIGLIGPEILRAAHLVHDAEALRELMTLARELQISWGAVYLYLFLLSVIALLAINSAAIRRTVLKFQKSRQRKWDLNGPAALDYIATLSHFSTALSQGDRYYRAMTALHEAAQKGKIRVAGLAKDSELLAPIPRKVWIVAKLTFKELSDRRGSVEKITKLDLSLDGKVEYKDLFVDKEELQKVWPPKPVNWRI